ncbi:hypothetical protein GO986_18700 [Deinococcus sp. HMF7620]|uniref:Uncharacterized protein n=1 Tax=Deinococcus arboris TaxID=2682977 RepID=A0A7C9HTR1_9DEIO|nr:hypothetical protein [Deinococcus arboris]MVN88772.1 hypothetical protein [Deinococcus arboris]
MAPLTTDQLDRVRFFVQDDAWTAWEELLSDSERTIALEQALAAYRDLRLVAAYVLERVAAQARHDAAQATEVGAAVSAFKVGKIEAKLDGAAAGEEDRVLAATWLARARTLQRGVQSEARARAQGSSVSLDIDVRL